MKEKKIYRLLLLPSSPLPVFFSVFLLTHTYLQTKWRIEKFTNKPMRTKEKERERERGKKETLIGMQTKTQSDSIEQPQQQYLIVYTGKM